MNNIIKRTWCQDGMVAIEDLRGIAFSTEEKAHTFQIAGEDADGNIIALSGTVSATFLRADHTDVTISGSVSGGVISVTLTANCYAVQGSFLLTVFLTSSGQKTAIYAASGNVD